MNVVTAEQMRQIDRLVVEQRGIPAIELVERAGRAVAQAVSDLVQPGDSILVICGKGNNAADGFSAARLLAMNGYKIHVLPVEGTEGFSAEARKTFERLAADQATIHKIADPGALYNLVRGADLVIDALLGTGAKPPLRAPYDWIVRVLNDSRVPVLSIDIPTGLDADTGEGDPVVRAVRTVTMGLPKMGMLSAAGVQACGNVRVENLNFPSEVLADPAHARRTVIATEAAKLLPVRPIDGHKGDFGTVAICSGSSRHPGAAAMAGLGALRSGAGLVRMHVPGAIRSAVSSLIPEATFHIAGGDTRNELVPLAYSEWDSLLLDPDAVVFGPGVTMGDGPHAFMVHLLDTYKGFTLIDADGLNLLAAHKDIAGSLHSKTVLTPHPGEMGRLLRRTTDQIQKNRWDAVAEAAKRFNCTVVLKGWGTLVASPGRGVAHIPTGNTALARGSSGDLLAGMIGGLLAQGLDPHDASVLGAFVVGMGADILVADRSSRGVLIREVAEKLPDAFRKLESI